MSLTLHLVPMAARRSSCSPPPLLVPVPRLGSVIVMARRERARHAPAGQNAWKPALRCCLPLSLWTRPLPFSCFFHSQRRLDIVCHLNNTLTSVSMPPATLPPAKQEGMIFKVCLLASPCPSILGSSCLLAPPLQATYSGVPVYECIIKGVSGSEDLLANVVLTSEGCSLDCCHASSKRWLDQCNTCTQGGRAGQATTNEGAGEGCAKGHPRKGAGRLWKISR